MAIPDNIQQREQGKFKESTSTASQVGIVAINPDGSDIGSNISISEFPTAAAAADNTANPTTTDVKAYGMVYDGATWDRMPGDSTNGTKVQPATGGAGAVTATTQRTTLASDDPAVTALQIIDDWDESDRAKVNPIVGQAGVAAGSGTVSATTQRVVLATDVALPAGTNLIGKTNRSFNASTTDGFSRDISTALEPSSVTSAAPALLASGFIFIDDTAATDIYYLQFFNSTTVPADTTASTGIISPIIINHTTGTPTKVDFSFLDENGIFFSTGIAWAISTTQFTKTVAGNVATGTIFYKT